MPTTHRILATSYFPSEFPPPFTTEAFAATVCSRRGGLRNDFSATFPNRNFAGLGHHNLARSGHLRRNLGLPHPAPYAALAAFVSGHWRDLREAASASPFSLTKPVESRLGRAIRPEYSLDSRTEQLVALRSQARFILKADINRFFPSIYTHSLPWAVLGKQRAKQMFAAGTLRNHWSDALDTLVRNVNDCQTMGIPIGPSISRILSEIVLARVDTQLHEMHPSLRGIRYVDDYEFAFFERSVAERVANDLQSILGQFELALNSSKTEIIELPRAFEPLWTSRLRTFIFRDAGERGEINDLTAYFDLAFEYAKAAPQENTLKFAVARLNSVTIRESSWQVLQFLLGQSVLNEPACLKQTCSQITRYTSLGYQLDESFWSELLNRIIIERLPLGQASESVWALWMLLLNRLPLSEDAEIAVSECEDSLAALMGLALRDAGLTNSGYLDRLDIYAELAESRGRFWLLCYEGARRGWLTAPSGHAAILEDPCFAHLANNEVSFLDTEAIPESVEYDGGEGGDEGYD